MTELYICEKPSQASDLAAELGITKKQKGFIDSSDGQRQVTWAIGHFFEEFTPEQYDERYKSWDSTLLPIIPQQWKSNVRQGVAGQYKIVSTLLKKASKVYIATDFDREGEAIARNILVRNNYQGQIYRVKLSALDSKSIQKALNSIVDGSETEAMYYAALARTRSDWLVGMNMTRLFTNLSKTHLNYQSVINIGRVITPTVALVVKRDRAIENFKPYDFYSLKIQCQTQSGSFMATWMPLDKELAYLGQNGALDSKGRCINQSYLVNLANLVNGQIGQIKKAETKLSYESPPLPFSIDDVCSHMSSKHDIDSAKTKKALQHLYDNKFVSYPRTDTRYLPESQRDEAAEILMAIAKNDFEAQSLVAGADPNRNCRAYSDKNMKGASHHAIIPLATDCDLNTLDATQKLLYREICKRFVMQFYSNYEFNQTQLIVTVKGYEFGVKGRVPLKQGWRILIDSQDQEASETDEDADDSNTNLPPCKVNEQVAVQNVQNTSTTAKPPTRYTVATLLSAMKNIASEIDEPELKSILSENSGIGTGATRTGIIEKAISANFLVIKQKSLRSTAKAKYTIDIVPPALCNAGLTALWEQELEKIACGEGSLKAFTNKIQAWVTDTIERSRNLPAEAFKKIEPPTADQPKCFKCSATSLKRIKGKNGFFWSCQQPECKATFNDNRNKPVDPSKSLKGSSSKRSGSTKPKPRPRPVSSS